MTGEQACWVEIWLAECNWREAGHTPPPSPGPGEAFLAVLLAVLMDAMEAYRAGRSLRPTQEQLLAEHWAAIWRLFTTPEGLARAAHHWHRCREEEGQSIRR